MRKHLHYFYCHTFEIKHHSFFHSVPHCEVFLEQWFKKYNVYLQKHINNVLFIQSNKMLKEIVTNIDFKN